MFRFLPSLPKSLEPNHMTHFNTNTYKGIQFRKEEVKLPLFAGNMISYLKISKDATKKLLKLINKFSKNVRIQSQHTETSCISVH